MKYLTSDHREIQSVAIQGVFWIEDSQGYLNLDSYFAFHYLVYVWECIKVQQNNTILPISQVQGLLWTSLTSAIIFSGHFINAEALNDPKQLKNVIYKVKL